MSALSYELFIKKLARHFIERGDTISLDCLKFSLARPVYMEESYTDNPDNLSPKSEDACADNMDSLSCQKENFFKRLEDAKKVILYGAGYGGYNLYIQLRQRGVTVPAFIDTYKNGEFLSTPIISIEEYKRNFGSVPIVISSPNHTEEIEMILKKNGLDNYTNFELQYSSDTFLYTQSPEAIRLYKESGSPQYFSLTELPHVEDEVFVDCGAYTGDSTRDFIMWSKAGSHIQNTQEIIPYKSIFAFEPDPWCYEVCCEDFKKLKGSKVFKAGVSDKTGTLNFQATSDGASKITDKGDIEIKTVALDEALEGEKVTFIKMDIEGAELSALKGAEKIIRQRKPKLAICVYHKYEDIWEIAEYIWSLNPDYKMYLRHYSNSWIETVLYAIP